MAGDSHGYHLNDSYVCILMNKIFSVEENWIMEYKVPVRIALWAAAFCSAITVWQDKMRHVTWEWTELLSVRTIVNVSETTRGSSVERASMTSVSQTWRWCYGASAAQLSSQSFPQCYAAQQFWSTQHISLRECGNWLHKDIPETHMLRNVWHFSQFVTGTGIGKEQNQILDTGGNHRNPGSGDESVWVSDHIGLLFTGGHNINQMFLEKKTFQARYWLLSYANYMVCYEFTFTFQTQLPIIMLLTSRRAGDTLTMSYWNEEIAELSL